MTKSTWRNLAALVVMLAASAVTWAQAKPDLSGTWTLDAARSDPAPAGGGGGRRGGGDGGGFGAGRGGGGAVASLVIKQTPTELSVTQNAQSVVYKLDGTETQGPPPGDSKNKAAWEGDRLVIAMKREVFAGADGYVTLTGKDVYSLAGGILTIERTPPQQKPTTRKLVYSKAP